MLHPVIIKQLWLTTEQFQAHSLLHLSKRELIDSLINRIQRQKSLTGQETKDLASYIEQRIALIRDLAQCRLDEQLV
ncbi:hypothetical protein cce_3636 [Crocosphaera subtropica ATCC 51142]|uniref:Uncharacterized protein n=1 Tax=Crocosphaera subtropica (strain ATCC 51142 / BH68) TaxID=43989 RepID=B1X0U5_CROS5|nr:hypothetical protein [Crocosphaera subtropica]ACB52984.1 hypothetical protein cce_3636 [Crocosphaera subtropica ATCC 51142]